METLTKRERIAAALQKEAVDRVPIGLWLHHPEVDQDPRALAETQVAFMRAYDTDFIKLCPFGLYSVQDWGGRVKFFCTPYAPAVVEDYGIKAWQDWQRLEVLPAGYGTWGKQVELAAQVQRSLRPDEEVPVLQTVFSPLTVARKLGGDRIFADMKEHPEAVHAALQAITATSVNFIRANISAGVSGFFFATQCASSDLVSWAEYEEFGERYDRQLFTAYTADTWFNVIHIHGQHIFFAELSRYPGNCVNWHDRWVAPSLRAARQLTDKCLLGGLNENETLLKGTPAEVVRHVAEAVGSAGSRGLILGPGCVTDPHTPAANYYAARLAAEAYGEPIARAQLRRLSA